MVEQKLHHMLSILLIPKISHFPQLDDVVWTDEIHCIVGYIGFRQSSLGFDLRVHADVIAWLGNGDGLISHDMLVAQHL